MATEILDGIVNHITYQNSSNGYTVCNIDSDGVLHCAVGYMPDLSVGESVSLSGEWTVNPTYGEQFKVESFKRVLPKETGAILMYLASGIIKGVGEATAKKLVDTFLKDTLKIIEAEPLRLTEIKGITKDKAMKIHAAFMEKRSCQETALFLQPFGVTAEFAMKAHASLGPSAVTLIKKNPYILCEKVPRIGFHAADKIAGALDFDKYSPHRIRSGIKYVLSVLAAQMGHTYMTESNVTEYSARFLGIDEDYVENQYTAMELSKDICIFDSFDEGRMIQLASYYYAEKKIADKLLSLKRPVCDEDNLLDEYIEASEKRNEIKLSNEQKTAVKTAISGGVTVITGGPGTGKTTIIKTITDCLLALGRSFSLAAPTGRAAKRMGDACGREAKTIHRLLEIGFQEGENASFFYGCDNPLPFDYIIVDEMSMVDTLLMSALTSAVKKGATLILLGDVDQLPPVGAGNILKDIIETKLFSTMRLTYIYRQAAESLIVTNAHRINNGNMPTYNNRDNDFFFIERESQKEIVEAICKLCKDRLPERFKFDPVTDIQVITPMKKSFIGTVNLNNNLQRLLNPPSLLKAELRQGDYIFRQGDKVMQIENDYMLSWTKDGEEGEGIYNGDLGIIHEINPKTKTIKVNFDDGRCATYDHKQSQKLILAYATTVHKSQGSEFPCVVMPIHKFAPVLMTRNLLYTAVTRAKSLVVLVGTEAAAEEMVGNPSEQKRYSGLTDKIFEAAEG